jgi:simple sugar transport system ATP-binding protein
LSVADPLLAVEAVSKRFGAVQALEDVSFAIGPGEIRALLGENGAGKSTLVKIATGLLRPDAGRLLWEGRPFAPASPRAARAAGLALVAQHFALFDALTVAENVALGLGEAEPVPAVAARLAEVSRAYGLPLDPKRRVEDLSVGEKQRVEVVRALLARPRLLVLDEPTSVLTPHEADALFEALEKLRGEGRSILYISHKLDEVRRLCDVATVLRRGRVVAEADPGRESAAALARLMVGEDVGALRVSPATSRGPPRLEADRLSLPPASDHGVRLEEVTFAVAGGTILGVAGVAGSGQDELFAALSGERLAPRAGMVRIDGAEVGREGVTARRRRGAAFAPEERLGHAAAPGLRLSENALATRHALGAAPGGLVRGERLLALVDRVSAGFDVRRGTRDPKASELSGGNLQKFVVGREIDRAPGVLVAAQPTWGVDPGAAALIREKLVALARGGAAVLVVSQDLDELLEMADEVAVMFHGRLSEAFPRGSADRDRIGLMMGGGGWERAA